MNESLRDVVDLSTVVGTVSTALLTCNSPNYTNNKNTLVNISQVFTSSSSTTTAIKDTMIFILHVLKCRTFFFFLHIYWNKILSKIFCGEFHDNQYFFVDLFALYIFFLLTCHVWFFIYSNLSKLPGIQYNIFLNSVTFMFQNCITLRNQISPPPPPKKM